MQIKLYPLEDEKREGYEEVVSQGNPMYRHASKSMITCSGS